MVLFQLSDARAIAREVDRVAVKIWALTKARLMYSAMRPTASIDATNTRLNSSGMGTPFATILDLPVAPLPDALIKAPTSGDAAASLFVASGPPSIPVSARSGGSSAKDIGENPMPPPPAAAGVPCCSNE